MRYNASYKEACVQRDLKETEVLRLAIATQKNDRELFRSILDTNSNRNILLRGAIGVILSMVYGMVEDDKSAEDILDDLLMDYTMANMNLDNG